MTRRLPNPMMPPRCATQALTSGTKKTSAGMAWRVARDGILQFIEQAGMLIAA